MNAMMKDPQQPPVEVDDEEAKMRLQRRQARMDGVGSGLESGFKEAVTWRGDAEREWLSNLAQFESGKALESPTKEGNGEIADYRRTGDNITRPAVLLATSRVSDMLFPTSDRNWDITPSPDAAVPDFVAPEADEAGNPLSEAIIEQLEQEEAETRCRAMRTQIDDQLQESNYSGIGRDAIFDAMLYGSGVVKGPFARTKLCRKPDPETGQWKRQFSEEPTATATFVDLFAFYPKPCRNMAECEGVYELHLMNSSRLRDLADEPGFSRSQVKRALKTEKRYAGLASSPLFMRANMAGGSNQVNVTLDNRYPVVEFTGDMPTDTVIDFTQGLLDEAAVDEETGHSIIAKLADDELIAVRCNVWFVNGVVIKIALRPVDDNMPLYHVYNYEKRPDTPFGKGLPFVLRDDQLAAEQLWHAMMLNAIMSSGIQLAVKKGALEPIGPNNKSYDMTFTRPRLWEFGDDIEDINKAIQAFVVPNVIASIMPVYERAKQNGNEHAMLPAIAQGDATSAVPTSSGLSMLMNAANIVTRQLAKAWDDDVTTPLINAMYDWNLAHGKDEAKGDYVVIPRGVSHLLVKDVQAQRFLFALQTYSANPELMGRMKWDEWARTGLVVMELDAGKLLMDEKEYEAKASQQQPPPDARVIAEQNRAKQIENEFAIRQQELVIRQAEAASKTETDRWEAASRERVAQLNYQVALAGLDARERAEMAKIDKDMQSDGLWARLEAEKLASKERADQFEAVVEQNTAPGPRLA